MGQVRGEMGWNQWDDDSGVGKRRHVQGLPEVDCGAEEAQRPWATAPLGTLVTHSPEDSSPCVFSSWGGVGSAADPEEWQEKTFLASTLPLQIGFQD